MEEVILIKEAINYLKSGYTLYSIINNEKYIFKYVSNNNIHITSNNLFLIIDIYKFLDLYARNKFFIVDDIEEIDIEKDKEYYSWTQ